MFLAHLSKLRVVARRAPRLSQGLHAGLSLRKVDVPIRPKHVADDDIEEQFLKGSGPGGQKINKTSSAVQLKHLPTGIVVKVQTSRSRSVNRILARKRLAEQIDLAENKEHSWMQKKQEAQSKRKKKKSQKSRAKYRRLEEEKQQQQQQQQQQPGEFTVATESTGTDAAERPGPGSGT